MYPESIEIRETVEMCRKCIVKSAQMQHHRKNASTVSHPFVFASRLVRVPRHTLEQKDSNETTREIRQSCSVVFTKGTPSRRTALTRQPIRRTISSLQVYAGSSSPSKPFQMPTSWILSAFCVCAFDCNSGWTNGRNECIAIM
jgi:hypothetical protein